eukprot:maker-scaffold36_size508890-snap-gene-4.12 protein:Tk03713 transcript:maker-scaffold36_size508890-snap-gene-4.12-mRNA-1 annotation:"hypothetical protein VOLCADRAFT_91772"
MGLLDALGAKWGEDTAKKSGQSIGHDLTAIQGGVHLRASRVYFISANVKEVIREHFRQLREQGGQEFKERLLGGIHGTECAIGCAILVARSQEARLSQFPRLGVPGGVELGDDSDTPEMSPLNDLLNVPLGVGKLETAFPVFSRIIASATIASATIAAATIAAATIAAATIAAATIASATIASATIASATIASATIASATIASATIASATIASATIAAATIAAATIAAATIAAATIAAATIASATIASATIASATIASATIASATIASATIASATIASATIASATIASATIASATSASATIASATIASGSLGALLIAMTLCRLRHVVFPEIGQLQDAPPDRGTNQTLDASGSWEEESDTPKGRHKKRLLAPKAKQATQLNDSEDENVELQTPHKRKDLNGSLNITPPGSPIVTPLVPQPPRGRRRAVPRGRGGPKSIRGGKRTKKTETALNHLRAERDQKSDGDEEADCCDLTEVEEVVASDQKFELKIQWKHQILRKTVTKREKFGRILDRLSAELSVPVSQLILKNGTDLISREDTPIEAEVGVATILSLSQYAGGDTIPDITLSCRTQDRKSTIAISVKRSDKMEVLMAKFVAGKNLSSQAELKFVFDDPNMAGRVRQRPTANANLDVATTTVNERILRECHTLYTDEVNGLVSIAKNVDLKLLAPRKKISIMLIGNHSAGKSSFIN